MKKLLTDGLDEIEMDVAVDELNQVAAKKLSQSRQCFSKAV